MKKLILLLALFLTVTANSQELSKANSQAEAITKASVFVQPTTLSYNASQLFTEENKFLVTFGKTQNYLKVVFSKIGDQYAFRYVTGEYSDIIKIWQSFAQGKEEKYFDQQTKTLYTMFEDNDEKWTIKTLN